MESLTGSSLKGVCLDKIVDKQRGPFLYYKDTGLSKKSDTCFLGLSSSKLVHISLLSVQNKTIKPVSCTPLQSSFKTQTDAQSEEIETTDTNQSIPVRVNFQLYRECSFGQHFHIVGDDPVLGSWDPSNAVPLEWSVGHVWTVELDIPSGKTISYKFIMKEDAETILWQQGPDRILQTWETKKIITVSEDWDNAELQTIVEEEPVGDVSEEYAVNPEILVADNLVLPTELDLQDDVKEEEYNEVLSIAAENITIANEDVNTNLNEDTTMEAKTIGKNGMEYISEVLSSKDESNLIGNEKVPVLVPGLTQVVTPEVHIDNVVTESSIGSTSEEFNVLLDEIQIPVLVPGLTQVVIPEVHIDNVVTESSIGSTGEEFNVLLDEIQMNNVVAEDSLGSKSEELSSKDELATDSTHPKETQDIILNVKQEVSMNEDIEKSELVEGGGDWSNGKLMEENVFEGDIQWGKRTLQKFFSSLGFCKVELEG